MEKTNRVSTQEENPISPSTLRYTENRNHKCAAIVLNWLNVIGIWTGISRVRIGARAYQHSYCDSLRKKLCYLVNLSTLKIVSKKMWNNWGSAIKSKLAPYLCLGYSTVWLQNVFVINPVTLLLCDGIPLGSASSISCMFGLGCARFVEFWLFCIEQVWTLPL